MEVLNLGRLAGEPTKEVEEAQAARRTGWALVERMPERAPKTAVFCYLSQVQRLRLVALEKIPLLKLNFLETDDSSISSAAKNLTYKMTF